LILFVAASGCISNNNNSTENTFEPDNFLKTASLSEDNTTLTMIFDEDFDSDFRWELIIEPDGVLKISADEKMPTDELSQEIGKHKWVFEGNTSGTTELKFEYMNPLTDYTPERYAYAIKNTNGRLEIVSISSFSGNRSIGDPYTEGMRFENDTILTLVGQCVSSSGGGSNHWKLEQSRNDILNTINATDFHNTTMGDGAHWWKFEGQKSGNVTLTLNYENSEIGLISEIVYEIHVNENKEISILNMSYNSVKGEPVPYYKGPGGPRN
jgi:predicted secreted protein